MSFLDDDIDDLLRAFRADEAHLDDATRARIWARICDEVPDAPTALDTLDRSARVRHLGRRAGPHVRVLAIAAAVLVLVAVAALAIRSGPNDDDIVAGPPTTLPIPRDLDELADRVTLLPPTVLGSSPDATYTYRRVTRTLQASPDEAPVTKVEEVWIDLDGTGRRIIDDQDEVLDEPGSLTIGPLAPSMAVDLHDDADAVADAVSRQPGNDGTFDSQDSPNLLEILTYTGLPGPARAGVLRALDQLGFRPVLVPDLGSNLWRVEGPGPDGSMQADLDLSTGQAVTTVRPLGDGFDQLSSIEVDLRRDTHSS